MSADPSMARTQIVNPYAQIVASLSKISISDPELREAIRFFRDMEARLTALGPTWALAKYQAVRELIQLESYANAREWDLNTLTPRASKRP